MCRGFLLTTFEWGTRHFEKQAGSLKSLKDRVCSLVALIANWFT